MKLRRGAAASMLRESREFAVKGSAVDLAVGWIVGAAFGKIVNSLVGDVIMASMGLLLEASTSRASP